MSKKGYNWKARKVAEVRIDDSVTEKVKKKKKTVINFRFNEKSKY